MRNNGIFVKHIWYLIAGQLVKHIWYIAGQLVWYIAGQLGRGKFPRGSRPHVIQPRQYATHLSYYAYLTIHTCTCQTTSGGAQLWFLSYDTYICQWLHQFGGQCTWLWVELDRIVCLLYSLWHEFPGYPRSKKDFGVWFGHNFFGELNVFSAELKTAGETFNLCFPCALRIG